MFWKISSLLSHPTPTILPPAPYGGTRGVQRLDQRKRVTGMVISQTGHFFWVRRHTVPIYSWRETAHLFICTCLTRTTAIQMEYKVPSALPAVLRHLGNNTDGYQLVEWGACKHVRVLVVLFVCSVVFLFLKF